MGREKGTKKDNLLSSLIAEADLEVKEIEKRATAAYTNEDVIPFLCEHYNEECYDLREPTLTNAVIGLEPHVMNEMVAYFLTSLGLKSEERRQWGPPKWQYTEGDIYDTFDYYMMTGCPNCGNEYELGKAHYATVLKPFPALECLECGHRAAPLHFHNESDAWVDRYEGKSHGASTKSDPDSLLPEGANSHPSVTGAIYLRGTRSKVQFADSGKEWWHQYFVPKLLRLREVEQSLNALNLVNGMKGQKVQEKCDICGNEEAFFHQFQARSADEGSTIMYECTKCQNRKVFNN